jgi:hypothetical protein
MSDPTNNVVQIGGGGLLYEDAREAAREAGREAALAAEFPAAAEETAPDPPPWADEPQPQEVQNPPPMKVGKIEAPKEPEPPFDWREAISTGLELAGIALLITTGFLITVWLGTLIAGLCLVLLGVATSNNYRG